jgi:hypothetical protein
VLIGFDVMDVDAFALLQLRQAAVLFVLFVVAAFLVELQEAVEENDSIEAASICDATARFQISS